MLLKIVSYPDESLKKICDPVVEFDSGLADLADNMLETMYVAKGVGLAAPQIGRNIRMIVADPEHYKSEKNPLILINPEIELLGETIISDQEGCLSVPMGYRADVQRNDKIKVKYKDLNGIDKEEIFEGFTAIVIQHEVDHLDGILFIDKISRLKRSLYDSKVKRWLRQNVCE
ncbi:MAG: peptide deformylase [Desulfovibrio sp.]|nr:peptide deformylase [Desulfovibrio sp.]